MALTEQFTQPAPGAGLERARAPLAEAYHLPGYIYSSPDVMRMEKERIFMQDWLCVGRIEEVANPGDYIAFHVMEEPVIVARGTNGTLSAFLNTCRHRGVEVAQGRGQAQQFTCPYHGWTYDLEGKLIGAAFMDQAATFDPANCRLTPVRLDEWAGWIFITFSRAPEPLSEFVADFERDFGVFRMGRCRLATTITFDIDCNWKLFVENAMDNYHVNTLHATTLGKGGLEAAAVRFDLNRRGGYTCFYDMPTRGDGLWFGADAKMPWLEDKPDDFAAAGFLAPNMQIFAYVDNVEFLVYWPTSLTTHRMSIYVLFPEEFFGRPNFEEVIERYRRISIETIEEDREMVQSLQRAMASRGFEPGPLSHVEKPIHNVFGYYLERMFGAP